ncbi:hypothetical protein DSO57_1037286 [Entomophthora muscae]|uniref:Uncharacterized protein n=1 Tax=Entomophthora muscae TaxID=34485 RepID=A0ACC2TLR6_9FUNG|nr:hypothetical protein DSO57_1037286 [Entomophthora muscae]
MQFITVAIVTALAGASPIPQAAANKNGLGWVMAGKARQLRSGSRAADVKNVYANKNVLHLSLSEKSRKVRSGLRATRVRGLPKKKRVHWGKNRVSMNPRVAILIVTVAMNLSILREMKTAMPLGMKMCQQVKMAISMQMEMAMKMTVTARMTAGLTMSTSILSERIVKIVTMTTKPLPMTTLRIIIMSTMPIKESLLKKKKMMMTAALPATRVTTTSKQTKNLVTRPTSRIRTMGIVHTRRQATPAVEPMTLITLDPREVVDTVKRHTRAPAEAKVFIEKGVTQTVTQIVITAIQVTR